MHIKGAIHTHQNEELVAEGSCLAIPSVPMG